MMRNQLIKPLVPALLRRGYHTVVAVTNMAGKRLHSGIDARYAHRAPFYPRKPVLALVKRDALARAKGNVYAERHHAVGMGSVAKPGVFLDAVLR